MKQFRTKYGSFSPDGSEYVIATPRTPRPWINVISNGDYGMIVSQAGGGYSWRTHAQLNRLTRWEQDLVRDRWGKYVYLRDDRGNLWSAGWTPVCAEPESYVCRHGIGYTIITALNFGVETELLMFVPFDAPLELWRLTIRNRTSRTRTIDVFTYLEWGLGQSPDWHREFHKSFMETEYHSGAHAILATKRLWEVPTERGHWNINWPYAAFHSSSVKPTSFDTDKETFLGMYGAPDRPAGVLRKRLARRTGNWLDPCASLHHTLTLSPRGEERVDYTLGCAGSRDEALSLAEHYQAPVSVDRASSEVSARWNALLHTVHVVTPDASMDVMENIWLKYQAISGRIWARTAYYQTGGAYGFRDQLQDSMAWLPIDPVRTGRQLRLHAAHQFRDGTVYHWWHPLSEVGLRNRISDNLLWLPYVLHEYLKETADYAILDAAEPFLDDPQPLTMYEHCVRAIDRALERFSPRGLPLIGEGDWNDGLSAVGLEMKGESIWLGEFLYRILTDFSVVARLRKDGDRAMRYADRAEDLCAKLNALAWDGEYYYGATKDSGEKIGSHENVEGSLWLNPQSWAIISGIAGTKRAEDVFRVIERKLECEIGPLLLAPAYRTPDPTIGYLTRYAPGMRENGGVYTHAATWVVIAAAMLGHGEAAHRVFAKLNPVNRSKDPDRFCAEPYVTPGNIEGPDSAFFGRGGWTWYTGSAAWLFRVGIEWILGVRPDFEGLVVDPCVPAAWSGYAVRRTFRGAVYHIIVKNPKHTQAGVAKVILDGRPFNGPKDMRGTLLPPFPAGSRHEVLVELGRDG